MSTCSFQYRGRPTDEGASCPRAAAGRGYCLFHLYPAYYDECGVTEEDVTAALCEELDGPEQRCDLRGAKFGSLDLSGRTLGSRDQVCIDLRNAEFQELVDLSEATVIGRLELADAVFTHGLSLADAEFQGPVDAWMADFGPSLDASGADFEDDVSLTDCRAGEFKFNNATFDSRCNFARVSDTEQRESGEPAASTDLKMNDAVFRHLAYFRGMDDVAASFERATFRRDAFFTGTTFTDGRFTEATFEGKAAFGETDHSEKHTPATFACLPSFVGTTFRGVADFDGVQFQDSAIATFEETTCSGKLRIDPVLTDTSEAHLRFDDVQLADAYLDFPTEQFVYGLVGGRLGHVDPGPWRENGLAGVYVRDVDLRTFNTHDFHDALESRDWNIAAPETPPAVDSYDRLDEVGVDMKRNTYMKAKTGAKASGHDYAAGEFFVKERRVGRPDLSPLDRLGDELWDRLARYGESPFRVVGWGILTIVVFAVFYRFFAGEMFARAGVPMDFWQALLFSSAVFGKAIGGHLVPETTGLRLLVTVESFFGTGLLALLIFTVGKRAAR